MVDGVRLNVGAEVRAILRTNLVAHIARDIAAAAGTPAHVSEKIMKAIQQKVLNRVTLVLQSEKQKPLDEADMYIIMEIDWDKHEMFLSQGTAKSVFQIDINRPPAEQVAPMLEKLRSFLAEKTRQYGDLSVHVFYLSRPGMRDEMRAVLGSVQVNDDEGEQLKRLRNDQSMVIVDKALSEFTVEVRYRGDQKD